VFADDNRLLERWWLKLPIAAYELAIVARDRLRYGNDSPHYRRACLPTA
jgi:hypothetical protein